MTRNVLVLLLAAGALALGACQGKPIVDDATFLSGSDSDKLPPPPAGSTEPAPLPIPLPNEVATKEEVKKPAPNVVDVRDTRRVPAPGRVIVDPNGPKVGEVIEVRDVTNPAPVGGRVIVDPNGPRVGEVVETRDLGSVTGGVTTVPSANGPRVGEVVETRDLGVVGGTILPSPAPMPEGEDGGFGAEVAERAGVEADRRRFLVNNFIEKGQQALRDGDITGARNFFQRALDLDPRNETALMEFRRISDNRPSTVGDYMDTARDAKIVRRQKAAIQVRNHVERGRNLEQDRNYDEAIRSYRKGLAIISWYDESADFGYSAASISDLIERAQEKAKVYARAQRREAIESAAADQARSFDLERRRRLGRIRQYFTAANDAFRRHEYGLAREYANQVLREDPGNADAEQLIKISHDAEHIERDGRYRREFADQWKRIMKEVEFDSLPQVATVEFPDDWLDDIAHRTPRQVGDADEDGEEEGIASIVAVLNSKRVKSLEFTEASLDDVVNYFRTITGLNFVVTSRARDEQGESFQANQKLDDVSVATVLDIVMGENGLKWIPENGLIKIAMPEEISGSMKLRFFDVKDLEVRIADFVGQEINLTPSNFTPPEPPELEDPLPLYPTDSLPDLITQTIGAEGTWDEPAAVEKTEGGILIVRNTSSVLKQVQDLLDQLRANTGVLVNLEVRFLTVEDNFLRDVGVDVRGLGDNAQGIGAPGLGSNVTQDDVFFGLPAQGTSPEPSSVGRTNDAGIFYNDGQDGAYAARVENLFDTLLGNQGVLTGSGGLSLQHTFLDDTQMEVILRAVEKSERIQTISAPRVTVYNTQRANVQVLNQIAYVADYEVEIAQASNIANPVVQTILDGIVLDVRPVVSADRRFVSLELRPTVAVITRPIATFSTSLASGPIGANAPVIIQLPQLSVSRVRTTVNMPDKGTLLLGGLKFYEQQRLDSGIPFLSKLPILSFLLSRKGNYVNRRNLIVLITAEIVNLSELEPEDNLDVPDLPIDADWTEVLPPEGCAPDVAPVAAPADCGCVETSPVGGGYSQGAFGR